MIVWVVWVVWPGYSPYSPYYPYYRRGWGHRMDILTRRIGGRVKEFKIYPQVEADAAGIRYVPWKQAQPGDWALSDDGYVGECLQAMAYADSRKPNRARRLVTLTFGRMWVSPSARLEYLPRKAKGAYSYCSTKTWAEVEARKTRTMRTVRVYAMMVISERKVDWNLLGEIYRPDQKIPGATVRRLFKQEVIKKMADKEIEALLQAKGITKEHVIEMINAAYGVAVGKTDASNMLRAAENFMDMLQMKPNKMMLKASALELYEGPVDDDIEEIEATITRAQEELRKLGEASTD